MLAIELQKVEFHESGNNFRDVSNHHADLTLHSRIQKLQSPYAYGASLLASTTTEALQQVSLIYQ